MEIIRRKSELGTYDIEIKQDNKVLKIIFGGNLDLYWILTVTKDNIDIRKEKLETLYETFLLEFTRPPLTKDKYEFRLPGTITIRFRNSGSRYDPFNIIFMRMFRKLEEYDPDFHQIHIEELEYQKKLTRKQKI